MSAGDWYTPLEVAQVVVASTGLIAAVMVEPVPIKRLSRKSRTSPRGKCLSPPELRVNRRANRAIQPGFTPRTGYSAAQQACRAACLGYRGSAPASRAGPMQFRTG